MRHLQSLWSRMGSLLHLGSCNATATHSSHQLRRNVSCKLSPQAVFGSVTTDRAFLPEQDPLTR